LDKIEASLYVGCGITKDSNLENEWQETANKAMTMKNIIL
jgi:isochorismate synthase